MFKVLIVDDEELVVSLIENLIDWGRLNMTVAGTADNGYSALEKVESLKPDIVIVDVRMPGYDGLTFMQKVREINSYIKFIVISGHKKFEYARSAMKYNVEDYLIKPINREELEQILEKLSKKLETESKAERLEEELSCELTTRQKKLQSYFLDAVMNGEYSSAKMTEKIINETWYTNFHPGIYQASVLKIDSCGTKLDLGFAESLLYQLEKQLVQTLRPVCFEIAVKFAADCVYVVYNFADKDSEEVKEKLYAYFQEAHKLLDKFEQIVLTMGIGGRGDTIQWVGDSIRSASACIWARLSSGIGQVIEPSGLRADTGIIHNVVSDTLREKWRQVIRSLQEDQIKIQLFSIFTIADEYKKRDNLIFYEVLTLLHRDFFDYISKIDLYKKSYNELWEELWADARWACTGRMLADVLAKQIHTYISEYAEDDGANISPAIRIVKKYIAENYEKNISMAAMAEFVNLSSVYFSMLFKKEVGINFLDYLNSYRLEKSKEYLRQVRYNINEVAKNSGFPDAKYFSRLFKKTFGITPTEYRKRNVE